MRLRRSLFFVAPVTPAGTPSRRNPGESIKALPGRPGCGLPGAPRMPRPRRVRLAEEKVEKSRTGCAGAAGGRASAQAHRGRVFLANPGSECPFGPPWVRKGRTTENRRPDRRARRPVTACLPGIARHWSALVGKILPLSKCPRTVSRSRWASRRAPLAAAAVALRAPSAAADAKGTHAEKGERSTLHKQGNFLYCVDTKAASVAGLLPSEYNGRTAAAKGMCI